MYRVEYSKGVLKDLKALPQTVQRKALEIVENALAKDPYIGKPLSGPFKGLFKYRMGDYRIIYSVEGFRLIVFVLRIRHRKDVYRGII